MVSAIPRPLMAESNHALSAPRGPRSPRQRGPAWPPAWPPKSLISRAKTERPRWATLFRTHPLRENEQRKGCSFHGENNSVACVAAWPLHYFHYKYSYISGSYGINLRPRWRATLGHARKQYNKGVLFERPAEVGQVSPSPDLREKVRVSGAVFVRAAVRRPSPTEGRCEASRSEEIFPKRAAIRGFRVANRVAIARSAEAKPPETLSFRGEGHRSFRAVTPLKIRSEACPVGGENRSSVRARLELRSDEDAAAISDRETPRGCLPSESRAEGGVPPKFRRARSLWGSMSVLSKVGRNSRLSKPNRPIGGRGEGAQGRSVRSVWCGSRRWVGA